MDGKNRLTCMIFGRKIPCGNTNFHRGFCFMNTSDSNFFGTEKVSRILLKIAPPVMLAQLIQALYNIVDSLFVGKYSESGLTALSIIYPLQLLMIAIAVGTGVGINTAMAHYLGVHDEKKANEYGGIGTPLTLALWVLFAAVCFFFMPAYARMSTDSTEVIKDVICDCIRTDRLCVQHRTVYRKYLDKDFTGKWGYEDTDDRTDCGGTG